MIARRGEERRARTCARERKGDTHTQRERERGISTTEDKQMSEASKQPNARWWWVSRFEVR